MNKPDLQIARKVLGVLHDVEELSFNHPDLMRVGSENRFEGCALFEYDLSKAPPLGLPESLKSFSQTIEHHLRTTDSSDPWGMVDDEIFLLKLGNQPSSSTGKLFLFDLDYISALLKHLFPTTQITPAEQKALLQSLSGIPMKTAAALDSVSYETKKTQLKSVFQKTQLHSQQTLSSFLITHLALEVAAIHSRKPINAESDEMFFYYVDNYMGDYVRASVIQESSDSRHRVIELGDPAGTPVVCIHHLGLISFSEEEIHEIYRKRIRLICPLRHGALGPMDSKLSSADYAEHALAGIDLAVSLTGQKKAVIVTMLSGCLYAIKYLERFDEKVSNLIMLGASYKPIVAVKSSSSLKKNLHDLASNHEATLESTISTLLKNVDDPDKLKRVMMESLNNNDADNETIDQLFADKQQVNAMQHRLRNSPLSIVQDLKKQASRDWTPLERIANKSKLHFIHGSDDELIPLSSIKTLVAQNSDMNLHVVNGAGNWIFGSHTRQTVSIIRDIVNHSM